MTEPFVTEDGDIIESKESAVAHELRVVRTIGFKFTASMASLQALGDALKEHGAGDVNSLVAALKVADVNGKLIEVAQKWLKQRTGG